MNHAMEARELLLEAMPGWVRNIEHAIDHIIAAAIEAVEQKYACPECCLVGRHSPGCDVEAVRSDPNLPRRFRWHSLGKWLYGAYLPIGHCYVTATTCKGGKPDWPVEWIDPEPTN